MIRKTTLRTTILSAAIAALVSAGTALAQPEPYEEGQRAIRNQQWDLAVELFKGRIRVSLDVGNYPASTIFR